MKVYHNIFTLFLVSAMALDCLGADSYLTRHDRKNFKKCIKFMEKQITSWNKDCTRNCNAEFTNKTTDRIEFIRKELSDIQKKYQGKGLTFDEDFSHLGEEQRDTRRDTREAQLNSLNQLYTELGFLKTSHSDLPGEVIKALQNQIILEIHKISKELNDLNTRYRDSVNEDLSRSKVKINCGTRNIYGEKKFFDNFKGLLNYFCRKKRENKDRGSHQAFQKKKEEIETLIKEQMTHNGFSNLDIARYSGDFLRWINQEHDLVESREILNNIFNSALDQEKGSNCQNIIGKDKYTVQFSTASDGRNQDKHNSIAYNIVPRKIEAERNLILSPTIVSNTGLFSSKDVEIYHYLKKNFRVKVRRKFLIKDNNKEISYKFENPSKWKFPNIWKWFYNPRSR